MKWWVFFFFKSLLTSCSAMPEILRSHSGSQFVFLKKPLDVFMDNLFLLNNYAILFLKIVHRCLIEDAWVIRNISLQHSNREKRGFIFFSFFLGT